MNTLAALLIVLGLLIATFAPRKTAHGTLWLLLRSLFPSWRFFEDVGVSGELFYRVGTPGITDSTSWLPLQATPRRTLRHLFHNPEGGLRFAEQSLLDQLLIEAESSTAEDHIIATVPYQLLKNLIETRVSSSPAGTELEFKILEEAPVAEHARSVLFQSSRWLTGSNPKGEN